MSKIRGSGTKLEKEFRGLLESYFCLSPKLNCKDVLGCPDMVFESNRVCVFLDGDFWHGWQYPKWRHRLKNSFWRNKIETNRKRDGKVTRLLRADNWKVVRLWEHSIKSDPEKAMQKVLSALRPSKIVQSSLKRCSKQGGSKGPFSSLNEENTKYCLNEL